MTLPESSNAGARRNGWCPMRSVRISLKTARALRDLVAQFPATLERELRELSDAMAPKKSVRASAARRVVRQATKKEMRAEIRTALEARANGSCEACGMSERFSGPLEWDHMFGRVRVRESERSGWMLCHTCHRDKTANRPSAATWLEAFVGHCERYGYREEAGMATRRLGALELSDRAAAVAKGAP
jgi:hypothetical protein